MTFANKYEMIRLDLDLLRENSGKHADIYPN